MREYLVVIEKAENNYSAYSPDLPACVATGDTKDETLERMREAVAMHLQGLQEDGIPAPVPSSTAEYVAVG